MCNPDYAATEPLHGRPVRTTTCANGHKCDYAVFGDRDECLGRYSEYVNERGYRRNREMEKRGSRMNAQPQKQNRK